MTRSVGSELMARLSAGVRPQAAGESQAGLHIGADVFSAALQRASAGDLRSDLPVTVARGVDIDIDPETLDRLGGLVDRAQAQGASRALVLTDEGMLELDVLRRRIEGVVTPTGPDVLGGFDTVLIATASGSPFGARSEDPTGDSDDDEPLGRPIDPAAELTGPLHLPGGGFEASAHAALLEALDRHGHRVST